MFNFNLAIPTEFHFGRGCEAEVGKVLKQYGSRVLMVYGSNRIFKAEEQAEGPSLGDRLVASMAGEGLEVVPFGGVVPNPLKSHVVKAAEMCREEKIDAILAVGGGSVMDTAKAIASLGAKEYGLEMAIVNVVTAPATSSESNPLFVLTDDETHEKNMTVDPAVMPKATFLNPELTLSLPASQTAAGAFDAFSHAFERFFDLHRESMLLDEMTASVMRSIVKTLPKLLAEPDDYNLRTDMMLAAAVAHNDVLGPGGDFACHEISHAVTEAFGTTHGAALALVIPAWMGHYAKDNPERFAAFAEMVFDVDRDGSLESKAQQGIDRLVAFAESAGLPVTAIESDVDLETFIDMILKGRDSIGGGFTAVDRDALRSIVPGFLKF